MRRDYLIAILLALSAIPFAVALMAFPLLFEHPPRTLLVACVFGGFALGCILLAAAFVVAVRENATAPHNTRQSLSLIGMLIFGLGFIACAGVYFWPAPKGESEVSNSIPNRTERFGDLSSLSNTNLIKLTNQFVNEVRTYEDKNYVQPPYSPDFDFMKPSDIQQNVKQYEEKSKEFTEALSRHGRAFLFAYADDIMALKDELTSRLQKQGIVVPQDKGIMLFRMRAYNIHDVQQAMQYISLLAARLPN